MNLLASVAQCDEWPESIVVPVSLAACAIVLTLIRRCDAP